MICTVALVGSACGSTGHGDTVAKAPPSSGGAATSRGAATSAGTRSSSHATAGADAVHSAPRTTTVGAGSETAAFTQTVLPPSTPISSAQYHDAVVKAVEAAGKTSKTGEATANCVQQILHNAGIETVGDAGKIKRDPTGNKQVANGALQCLASVGALKPHAG